MNTYRRLAFHMFVSVMMVSAFAISASAQKTKTIDFSRLVVVGDSLAAGVENGSLQAIQQESGFAAVIGRQVNSPLVLPLVPYPGAPNTLELVGRGFPPDIQPLPGTLLFPRYNPLAEITDVAVPLQTVSDALGLKPRKDLSTTDETQLATDVVLGYPCPILLNCPALTQVQHAIALRPTTLIVDIGNNDILEAVTSGGISSLLSCTTPIPACSFLTNFGLSYAALLDELAATKATLIVGNIPDVMEAAYFIPVPELAAAFNLNLSYVEMALGLGTGDYVTLDALPSIEAILSNPTSGPLQPFCVTGSPTIPCVITQAEAQGVREITMAMNNIITSQIEAHGAVRVDLFSLVDTLAADGYQVDGLHLTTGFLGGLFSLDGIHPTNTGYGIMANEFIKDMNQAFGTKIPSASIPLIALLDPLVFH